MASFLFPAAIAALRFTAPPAPVLRFTDCKSQREIVLVGCMHNNPTSIRLVQDTVREYAANEELGAVVLESCPARWESAERLLPAGSLLRIAFDNEFQAAGDAAVEAGCGLALVDQQIEVTCGRLAQIGKQTVVDLASPLDGGWKRIIQDLRAGQAALQDENGDGVSASAFVSPALLAGAPVAWLRYFFGSPVLAGLFVGVGLVLSAAVGVGEATAGASPLTLEDLVPSILLAVVESVLLLRVSLVGLIEERNFVLARNVRAASMQVLIPPRAVRQRGSGKDGRAVVAVLGMAHLNGVRRLLTTSRAV